LILKKALLSYYKMSNSFNIFAPQNEDARSLWGLSIDRPTGQSGILTCNGNKWYTDSNFTKIQSEIIPITGDWVVPNSVKGRAILIFSAVGGGGGGGSGQSSTSETPTTPATWGPGGGGGAAGDQAQGQMFSVKAGDIFTISVGSGGSSGGGSSGGNGGKGQETTVSYKGSPNTIVVANGGEGGMSGIQFDGGAGGAGPPPTPPVPVVPTNNGGGGGGGRGVNAGAPGAGGLSGESNFFNGFPGGSTLIDGSGGAGGLGAVGGQGISIASGGPGAGGGGGGVCGGIGASVAEGGIPGQQGRMGCGGGGGAGGYTTTQGQTISGGYGGRGGDGCVYLSLFHMPEDPEAPVLLTASAQGSGEAEITWEATGSVVPTSYLVQYAPDNAGEPGSWTSIQVSGSENSYVFTGLQAQLTWFQVIAIGQGGISLPSNTLTTNIS
jgi:hypothetical protein